MTTADELKRLIEGCSSAVSADSAPLHGFSNKKKLGSAQNALLKLPKWWLLFVQEYAGILMHYIQKLMEKIKPMKKHLERVWEDIIHLLEEEFPLAIQTPAVPYVCPCEELPSSTTSQTPLQFTKLISYRAKENYSFLCGCSVASFKL